MTCIGEPISWLRLERHALAEDAAVAAHLEACAVCRESFMTIAPIALPPLIARPKRSWWPRIVWGASFAAAAAALLLFFLARGGTRAAEDRVRVKGGDATVSVVRDRGGAIELGATSFRTTDRLKVRLSCPPAADGASYDADVVVYQGNDVSHPLDRAPLTCGNNVTFPGAFHLTDQVVTRVCLSIDGHLGCVTLSPE